jgi:hypothetical protein
MCKRPGQIAKPGQSPISSRVVLLIGLELQWRLESKAEAVALVHFSGTSVGQIARDPRLPRSG